MRTDIQQTSTIDMSTINDYKVDPKSTDGIQGGDTTRWTFSNFTKWYGYYDDIPELKKAVGTYATWVVGQGYTTDNLSKVILDKIIGSGEDDFTSILWNMLVIKKVNGDAFAEIVRNNKGTLINIKPLNPQRMAVVFSKKGIIEKYEYSNGSGIQMFKPNEIFHLVNDRVADNVHGDSVIKALQWLINSRQEAMVDKRRMLHLGTIRIIEVDEDDKTRLANLKIDWKDSIENGNVLLLPKGTGQVQDLTSPNSEHIVWIKYLENAFYKAVGTPKTLAGDAEGIPESGGKMVVFTHEPTYIREVTALEKDIWNQLAIKVEFKRQSSLQENTQEQEDKSTNQVQASQPNDTGVTL